MAPERFSGPGLGPGRVGPGPGRVGPGRVGPGSGREQDPGRDLGPGRGREQEQEQELSSCDVVMCSWRVLNGFGIL